MTSRDGGVGEANGRGSLPSDDERFFGDRESRTFVFTGNCCETRRHLQKILPQKGSKGANEEAASALGNLSVTLGPFCGY
jgi:hypothetical protein